MKQAKGIRLIAALFLLAGCNNDSETKPATSDSPAAGKQQDSSSRMVYNFTDSILQQKITDTLMQLPFIKESNHHIDSISHHAKSLSFITDTTGGTISVMAGYNGVDRFETYYHFSIDPQTFAIRVLDNVSGDFIPVADFLKKNKHSD